MTAVEIRQIIVRAMNEWVGAADRPEWAAKLVDPGQDVRFTDLDVDSLAAAEISMLLEDETGYACDLGDFVAYPSIQTLAEFISGEIGDRSD